MNRFAHQFIRQSQGNSEEASQHRSRYRGYNDAAFLYDREVNSFQLLWITFFEPMKYTTAVFEYKSLTPKQYFIYAADER
ncbi:hypothetical protein H6F61_17135 [Cyanobacteria bacterium FACHB-472]|nr:hypothetical protein [Cyanobacteria bacterium FACHB-472]